MIIVTGFSNSGTSFLCNLIHEMGFSVGDKKNLKGADSHNRWGYWEHLPIRNLARSIAHPNLSGGWHVRWVTSRSLPRDESIARKIALLALYENVEVVKIVFAPMVYRSLPHGAKYVAIKRNPIDVYKSPKRAGFGSYSESYDEFLKGYNRYHVLLDEMCKGVDSITTRYELFKADREKETDRIANFLGVTLDEPERVYSVFRPRN